MTKAEYISIIPGSGSKILAEELSATLDAALLYPQIAHFKDGEIKVRISDSLAQKHAVIVQSIATPVNDRLMEVLLLADAAWRAGSQRITLLAPYLGYSRQDRATRKYEPVSASLVIRLLETAGITHVITADLHSKQIEGFFAQATVENVESLQIFDSQLQNISKDVTIVSPDAGGLLRARKASEYYNLPLAFINKYRDSENNCHMDHVVGNVQGKRCIIIDDIIDSAATICQAAELLMKSGATSVDAYATHAVLSGNAVEIVQNSALNKLYVTDTINHRTTLPKKFELIPIAAVFAAYIKTL